MFVNISQRKIAQNLAPVSLAHPLGLKRWDDERFYTEGLSDTTVGLHPKEVLDGMDVTYNSQIRHDYRDDDGAGHELIVNYYQGRLERQGRY